MNQLVVATYTFCGTLIGGYLAFRFGWRQHRNARAIDKRLDWSERLHAAVIGYRSALLHVVMEFNYSEGDRDPNVSRAIAQEARERGREVMELLSRAEFYGTVAEREEAKQITAQLMYANVVLITLSIGEQFADGLKILDATMESLDDPLKQLSARVRRELGLTG